MIEPYFPTYLEVVDEIAVILFVMAAWGFCIFVRDYYVNTRGQKEETE